MPITFPIFDHEPNFAKPVERRSVTAQDLLRMAGAQALVTWPQDRTETAFTFAFALRDQARVQAAKDFIADRGGQHEAFLMPTWQRDFSLAEAATEGDTQLAVAVDDYAGAYLTTTADDEPGRLIFCYDGSHDLFTTRIIRAIDESPGLSRLELENALPWTPDPGAIWGHLMLVRLTDDTTAFNHATPEHVFFELNTITVRQRSTASETMLLAGSTGPEATEPFTRATWTPGPSPKLRFDYAHADGPDNLHFPQDHTFAVRWCLWLGSSHVRLAKASEGDVWPPQDDLGTPSALFPDGKPATAHISLAFDQNAWEVAAWENTAAGTITVRRRFNGAIVEHTFEGRSPALFNDGILAVDARINGLSDVVCYYDKPGHNRIFARIQRNNFGTEHTVILGPAKLRQMIGADRDGQKATIAFIDDSFRLVTATTDAFPVVVVPPSPYIYGVFDEAASAETEIAGAYELVIRQSPDDTSDRANLGPELRGALLDTIVTAWEAERASLTPTLFGQYRDLIVRTAQTDDAGLALSVAAVYAASIIATPNNTEDAAVNLALSGSYA